LIKKEDPVSVRPYLSGSAAASAFLNPRNAIKAAVMMTAMIKITVIIFICF
jgi:hypothetical protein